MSPCWPQPAISPWVKRGYVSHVHYNEASIWRTVELILGHDDPLNASWANAAPLYDLFTSTPDYTPYTRLPRVWPDERNPAGTTGAALAAHWDFSAPDAQPGLHVTWGYGEPSRAELVGVDGMRHTLATWTYAGPHPMALATTVTSPQSGEGMVPEKTFWNAAAAPFRQTSCEPRLPLMR